MSAPGDPLPHDPECAFCGVVAGELPARVVLESDYVVGFLDRRPLFAGHVLLVPVGHYEHLEQLPSDTLTQLMEQGRRVARAQQATLDAAGNFIALNNKVSQSVPHVHLHVVPRSPKDGLRGFFWPRNPYADDQQADEVAARLKSWLEGPG